MTLGGQIREIRDDLRLAQLAGVSEAVISDEANDPAYVCLLGARA